MHERRHFLSALASCVALGASASWSPAFSAPRAALAKKSGWRLPDEHAPQERVFLAYAASERIWGDEADRVNGAIALLARTIAAYQPVTVLCRPADELAARAACGTDTIEYPPLPLNDIWVRDYGGVFVVNDAGELGLVDFNFNGWGAKQAFAQDTRVARALSDACDAAYLRAGVVGEGGGIEVDGHGTAILTESCWVNANRNRGTTRARIESEIKRVLGLRKIIWLPGIKGKDITDAHVDFYARFVEPGVVIANLDNDPDSYDYAVTRRHLKILEAATDADGRKLQVHTLPPPLNPRRNAYTRNPDFAAGYINYLPINGAVIAPQFGDGQADRHCKDLLGKLYPGRTVVQVDIDPIAAGGGGIHCVTKHLPRT